MHLEKLFSKLISCKVLFCFYKIYIQYKIIIILTSTDDMKYLWKKNRF